MVKSTREQLLEKRDSLQKSLAEVQEQLNKFNAEVYGGKMKKAIQLLKECHNEYLHYSVICFECPECETEIDFEIGEIIDELQNFYMREF